MKRLLSMILAAAVALAVPALALADSYTGKTWNVKYTTAGELDDDFTTGEYTEAISSLQPGDDITLTVQLSHDNSTAADWYLLNDVVKTLEDASSASGSAYTYRLSYKGPSTSRTLFDSESVGGTGGNGLHDADSALGDEFIYLDHLKQGEEGTVTLYVALDGETEGNAYFNTLAKISLKFAVEPDSENESNNGSNGGSNGGSNNKSSSRTNLVKTGEENRLFPFYVAMFVSGLLFAGLAVVSYRERKNEEVEVQR